MNEYMTAALEEAKKAFELGEVPVGAVVVKDGEIIARAHNLTETSKDPTAHAEVLAIREAARVLGGWRLIGCDLYVTVEPCSMCAGAIVWSRVERLFYGAKDPKAGAAGSLFDIPGDARLNHNPEVTGGVMEEECSAIVKDFFRALRTRNSKYPSKE